MRGDAPAPGGLPPFRPSEVAGGADLGVLGQQPCGRYAHPRPRAREEKRGGRREQPKDKPPLARSQARPR